MTDIAIRYLHFLGIIVFASMLVAEHILVKAQLSREQIRRVASFDAVYGLSALVVLFAGLALWFWVGKPADFYSKNPVFMIKITAFVLMGILSVVPTVFFLKRRKSSDDWIMVPRHIIWFIRLELLLLVVIPLLAVLMASGFGLAH